MPLALTGTPRLELDLDVGRLVRAVLRRSRQRVDVLGRLRATDPRARRTRSSGPRGWRRCCRGCRSSAGTGMLRARGVVDFLRARHAPDARRRDDLDRRDRARGRRDVEAHLVVRLAVAAVRDAVAPSIRAISTSCGRSAAARARSPAGSDPRRARRPGAPAGCSRARTPRARRSRARAPRRRASARSRTSASSRPCPRSSVTAMTSAPYFSASQAIATEVSSPPEYARTIRSIQSPIAPTVSTDSFNRTARPASGARSVRSTHERCRRIQRARRASGALRQITRIVLSPAIVPTNPAARPDRSPRPAAAPGRHRSSARRAARRLRCRRR